MSEVDDEEEEDDMNDEDGSEDDDEDEDEDEDSDEDDDEDDDEEEVTPTKKKSKGRSKGSKKKQTSRKLWSKSVSSLSTPFHPFSLTILCFINPRLSRADLTLFSLNSLLVQISMLLIKSWGIGSPICFLLAYLLMCCSALAKVPPFW